LDLVLRAHGLHCVAGIDQPLERIWREHFDDVGDLHDVEQRRHPRHDVLAGGGGRRNDRVVARRKRGDQGGHRLGHHVLIGGGICNPHLLHAVEFGGSLGHRAAGGAGDQHMHGLPERLGGGQCLVSCVLEGGVVVLGEQKRGHVSASGV